jgi:hypothetical protein
MTQIDKDKYMVQDFMCLLKKNIIISVHTMVHTISVLLR